MKLSTLTPPVCWGISRPQLKGAVLIGAVTVPLLAGSSEAMLLVRYQTSRVDSLPPEQVNPAVTATPITAGAGIQLNSQGSTFNWTGWDPNNQTFEEAVADDEFWRWGFEVTAAGKSIIPTSFDIRLDRSGTGPDDFEIRAAVNNGTSLSLLSYSFDDSTSGVNFVDVDWSLLGPLGFGDEVEFTLAAFNSEGTTGTFDLETVFNPDRALELRADIASVPGPMPLFGAAMAFGTSRRIRKRLLQHGILSTSENS